MAEGILVFIEARNGQVRKSSLEALSEARRQCDRRGGRVTALMAGHNIRAQAEGLFKFKPDSVLLVDHPGLSEYASEGFAEALAAAVRAVSPAFVFAAQTSMAKDLIPRVAARLDAPCATDVVELRDDGSGLCAVHPVYSGKAYALYEFSGEPVFITLRPNVFFIVDPDTAHQASVENLSVELPALRSRVVETHSGGAEKIDVSEARIIVSGGRGIKGPENWAVLQELCDVLGAALGASRAVVDAGWIDHQHQVGQTGKTVSPQLYIACGISGAIQHLAGMSSSKVIVAINNNPEAPIFKHATYGVVGDIFEVVPRLTAECRKLLSEN